MSLARSARPEFFPLQRLVLAIALFCEVALPGYAQIPDYARTALAGLATDMPVGWAYTIATTRNEREIVERFDPSQPAGSQWHLLRYEGREPSEREREKYAGSRPKADSGGPKSIFQRADIEPGSLRLIHEDADHAEFLGEFRSAATESDKMLGHLQLRLTVNKAQSCVDSYSVELREPYSPVLGVKMESLQLVARYSLPSDDIPPLPAEQVSTFKGRILFVPTSEEIRISYRDFRKVVTELSR